MLLAAGNKNLQENDSFYQPSKYPAFLYKIPEVEDGSLLKSSDEEIDLVKKLIKDDIFNHQSLTNVKLYAFNHQVYSVLQGFKRPMCGLAALHMGAQMLQQLQPSIPQISLEEIYLKAVELKVSKKGEMFSAFEMAKLASALYKCKTEVHDGELHEDRLKIVTHLLQGMPVLVPYDNDRNFEPCLQNGHKAHWALITGAVIGSTSNFFGDEGTESIDGVPIACKIKKSLLKQFNESLQVQFDKCCSFHVFVKQGKSAKNRLYCLKSLSLSNANLQERDPSRDWSLYHCPYPLSETLKNKYVILSV